MTNPTKIDVNFSTKKNLLELEYKKAQSSLALVMEQKKTMYNGIVSSQTEHVLQKISRLNNKIVEIERIAAQQSNAEYEHNIIHYKKVMKQKLDAINVYKVVEADGLWYPNGTLVCAWYDGKKSAATGTVFIYDGTQKIAARCYWLTYPEIGDYIVLFNRSNGKIRKMGDRITKDNKFIPPWHRAWFAEYDTPEDNYLTRQQKSASRD